MTERKYCESTLRNLMMSAKLAYKWLCSLGLFKLADEILKKDD